MPYPTPLGHRLGYDRDGTIVLIRERDLIGGSWREMHPDAVKAMNSTVGGGARITKADYSERYPNLDPTLTWTMPSNETSLPRRKDQWGLLFPQPMHLTGIYHMLLAVQRFSASGNSAQLSVDSVLLVSEDTTNLVDGTWSQTPTTVNAYPGLFSSSNQNIDKWPYSHQDSIDAVTGEVVSGVQGATPTASISPVEHYRWIQGGNDSGQQSLSLRNVRGIKVEPDMVTWGNWQPYEFKLHTHLYGTPEASSGGQFLTLWRADQDRMVEYGHLSWGDHSLSSSTDKIFRLKNSSTSFSAKNIRVTVEDELWYENPYPSQQLMFSWDGITWTEQLAISEIGAGTVSPAIRVRRNTPAYAALGTWSPRIVFDVGEWV